jgi:hypothetical protein
MLKEGFNQYIDNEDYHADREYISSSGLKLLLEDPREFHRLYVLNEERESRNTASLDFGSYVHALILEPHLVEKEFAVYDGTQRRGKKWEDFQLANMDKTIITKSQAVEAEKAVRIFNESKVWTKDSNGNDKEAYISSFFTKGKAEETLAGDLDGVKVKVRFDYRKEFEKFGSINDIKTTSYSINTKRDIEKISALWGYELSAALYCDMVEKYTGKKHDFYFCYINTKQSMVKLVKASEQMLEAGRMKYKEALQILKGARKTGQYYDKGIMEIDYVEK